MYRTHLHKGEWRPTPGKGAGARALGAVVVGMLPATPRPPDEQAVDPAIWI